MYTPPPRLLYYSVGRISVQFRDASGARMTEACGTCFLLRRGGDLFVVTNRHNVDYDYAKNKYTGAVAGLITVYGRAYLNSESDEGPIYPYEAAFDAQDVNILIPENSEEDLAVIPFDGEETNVCAIGAEMLGGFVDFADSSPGEPVIAFGYSKLANAETDSAIARSGIFASDPEHNFRTHDEASARRIAIEMLSTSGMSGSPVFALQRGFPGGQGIKFDGFRRLFLAGVNSGHYHEEDQKAGTIHGHLGKCIRSTVISELVANFDEARANLELASG